MDAVSRSCGDCYPVTGITYNMDLCHRKHVLEIMDTMPENEFAESYAHICLAMLLSRQWDCLVTNQGMWGKRADFCGTKKSESSVPFYMQPKNRIAQQDGFMEFCHNYFQFEKENYKKMFVSRCNLTYGLVNTAYDIVPGFSQFGSRQEIYHLIYHGQTEYLKHFPISLSGQEYSLLYNRLQGMFYAQQMKSSGRWLAREKMHPVKCRIRELAESHAEPEKIEELVKTYEAQFPKDFDLYALKAWLCFRRGKDEEAYRIIKDGIKRNPYNYVANQMARMLCRAMGRFAEAIKYDVIIAMLQENFFEYYRLPPGTCLDAEKDLCIGNPIALKHNPGNKKLILNIFVDGISQKVIEEEGLEKLMPFTYRFFFRGVFCTNVYTTGDWTLPSLASCVAGISPANHMIIHNKLTNILPEDVPILAEYFKERGYQTAKIDGDWRSNLSYGYGRGMDRIIYQHQFIGMQVEQITADVLDHMKLMKDTDQFIWMGIGELHCIADGFAQKHSVQVSLPLEQRSAEEVGISSAKQPYSENKRAAYIREMKHVDEYLAHIYRYIEETYEDNEIIVSLFGDHGQGYLVKEEEHFLAEGRSKVAMMFRGEVEEGGVCDEIVSLCDYLPILCKLADIPLKSKKIEGNLPVFYGGEKEREYAITESIHPGDAYQAAIVSKDYRYYFTSGGVVEYDGRFEPGDYSYQLLKKDGEECMDQKLKSYYFSLLMQHVESLLIH